MGLALWLWFSGNRNVVRLVVYLYGQRYLTHVGNEPTVEEKSSDIRLATLFSQLLKSPLHLAIVAVMLTYSVYAGFTYEGSDNWGFGVLFIVLSLITGLLMMIYKNLNDQVEKDRYVVLLLSLVMVIVFWGCFEQTGGFMNLYTQEKTNRVFMGMGSSNSLVSRIKCRFYYIICSYDS